MDRSFGSLLCAMLVLAGCGSSTSTTQRETAQFGPYLVRFIPIPALKERVPDGLTPLMFTFSWADPNTNTGITEADWEREAARAGLTVELLKRVHGEDFYKGPDGSLRKCTYFAKSKGLCGKPLGLSISQRSDLAKKLLARSTACNWVGFDQAYHTRAAYNLGAQDDTLHVAAAC